MPASASQPSMGVVVGLIALACVPYFVNLGTPPLFDANEPLYAQPPKEVLEWPEGDFLAPTWNGKTYFAHPPLSTWVTVPFYAVLGPSEFGHRLPMGLAAVLIILATYRLGRLAGGRRTALLAALFMAATPRFWMFCRQLSGDVYLVALLTWAFALAVPSVAGEGRRRDLRIANVLVGIGFLAKGPVILVLYGGALLCTWFVARPRAKFRELRLFRGLLLILLVGAPWFLYMHLRFDNFIAEHFGHYTFGRVRGTIGERPWWWYLQTLLGDAQPWLPVLPFGIVMAFRRDRRVATLLPVVMIAWTVLLFSIPAGKRNVYLLPMYPMIAVLMAPVAVAVMEGAYRWSASLAGWAAAFGCLVATLCLIGLGSNVSQLTPEIIWPILVFGAFVVPLGIVAAKRHGRWVTHLALATVLSAQAATALAFPGLARFRPIPELAERIREEQSDVEPEPAIIYRAAIHSLNFYLGRATKVASSADDLRAKLGDRRVAFVVAPARRFDAPGKGDPSTRVGLKHDMPEAIFEELARGPLLSLHFGRAVLGRGGSPTRDLLLLKLSIPE